MNVIILAAGRNLRLKGIVPAYHKPLLIVNGIPLISKLVAQALTFTNTRRVIIVCAPQNVEAISEVITGDPRIMLIIQREPDGVLNALNIGLSATNDDHCVLFCGDNVIGSDAWNSCEAKTMDPSDTTLYVHGHYTEDPTEALKFTYIQDGDWREKEPIDTDSSLDTFCWVGPLVFNCLAMDEAIQQFTEEFPDRTNSIGQVFNYYEDEFECVEAQSSDMGLPEDLL